MEVLLKSKKSRHGISLNGLNMQVIDNKVIITKGSVKREILINKGFKHEIINNICYVYNTESKSFAGTDFSNIFNCVKGLNEPCKRTINLKGSGFKIQIQPKQLVLNIGLSHPVVVDIPAGITVVQDTNKKSNTKENILVIHLTSIDINAVTKFAAELTKLKRQNPYKQSGIYVEGNFIKVKKSSKGK